MTRGLLQQQPGLGFAMPRPAASPQHGQKAQAKPLPPPRDPRSHAPRPVG
jgi:hypothetical protein